MAALLTLYSVCFGVGLLYVLIAGALGMHGGGGGHGGGDAGGGGGHDLGGHPGLGAGHAGHAGHTSSTAQDEGDGQPSALQAAQVPATSYNPFNLLSIMCFLAAFGGSGLIATALHVPTLFSFPLALLGGLFMAWLFYLLLTRVLLPLQSGSAPGEADMLGLEAEVLTPIEAGHFGEIAYVMQGSRFTAPAKLLRGEHAGRTDKVRIMKVENGVAYVEVRHQLLP